MTIHSGSKQGPEHPLASGEDFPPPGCLTTSPAATGASTAGARDVPGGQGEPRKLSGKIRAVQNVADIEGTTHGPYGGWVNKSKAILKAVALAETFAKTP